MAQAIKDSFLDLERHRQLLEGNIEKLQKSLQHWRTWEAEYEGFKEEILALPNPSREQVLSIGRAYEGDLVTKKEVEDILGLKVQRTADQVTNILSRRIDYVQQNINTVEKQLESAENKLASATIVSTPDVRNEEGLPVTDIVEQLDEDGNEIGSYTTTPGSVKGQLMEVLEKAGLKEFSGVEEQSAHSPTLDNAEPKDQHASPILALPDVVKGPKKEVTFAEDTKPGPEVERSKTAKRIEEIMEIAKGHNEPIIGSPVLPTDDSPEDAALRKQMLQYGMSEIGAVVAELDLEEDDYTDDEGYDDEGTSSGEEDEDEHGRSRRQVIDDEMRQRMIELEEKLGVRMMENVGPRVDVDIEEENAVQVHSNEVIEAQSERKNMSAAGKKSVKFAEELDISPAPTVPIPDVKPVVLDQDIISKAPTVFGDIVERKAPAQALTPNSDSQKKISRFKNARKDNGDSPNHAANTVNGALFPPHPSTVSLLPFSALSRTRTVPTGPAGMPLANGIVERDIPVGDAAEPDELDPALMQQQIATEYHRMRNRMISKQGGFSKPEEGERIPFDEEEGGPKKISRFMAARLARG